MEYEIQYESSNTYEDVVGEAIFEFMVLPCNDPTQIVTDYTVKSSIEEHVFNFKNFFGFETSRIRTLKNFKTFGFTVKAKVQKKDPPIVPIPTMTMEQEKDELLSNDFLIDHHIFLTKTTLTKLDKEIESNIPRHVYDRSVLEFLRSINKYVNSLLQYNTTTTDVKTTARDAVKQKTGVCQDYAHVFIAIAINSGVPSRYVSGYLNPMKKLIGGSMMHAWVESFVPGIGWVGFDPTNNLMVDINYVKVAHGADYNDCSPIKGVLKTSGSNKTSYQVQISTQ
ncbi:MAG TPA: transglutaminase family protein [Cytophagaceae bacterium]|jgi:transglutaminase-like putative cysteine protease